MYKTKVGDFVITDEIYRVAQGLSTRRFGFGDFSTIGGKVVEIKSHNELDPVDYEEYETGKTIIRIQIFSDTSRWFLEDRLIRVGNSEEDKVIEAIRNLYLSDVEHLKESGFMDVRIGLRNRIMFFEYLFCLIMDRPELRVTNLLEEEGAEIKDYEGAWDPYPEFLNRSRIEEWAFRAMEDYREKSLSSRYPDKEYLGYVILVQEEILQILGVSKEEMEKIKTEVAQEYFNKELAASFR